MGDQTSLVSRQEREANAKNQPMFRKRLFKDILIAISGSFRTATSNAACLMMSSPQLPSTLTMGELGKRVKHNIREDSFLSLVGPHEPTLLKHTDTYKYTNMQIRVHTAYVQYLVLQVHNVHKACKHRTQALKHTPQTHTRIVYAYPVCGRIFVCTNTLTQCKHSKKHMIVKAISSDIQDCAQ